MLGTGEDPGIGGMHAFTVVPGGMAAHGWWGAMKKGVEEPIPPKKGGPQARPPKSKERVRRLLCRTLDRESKKAS